MELSCYLSYYLLYCLSLILFIFNTVYLQYCSGFHTTPVFILNATYTPGKQLRVKPDNNRI
ncbi:MAG: hypothetical protein CSB48_11050 [Proteobacteria bacterium]|nr:MAG: hypothetical protein CSB48_11050 [Pseudomonadota bacterium]